MAFNASPQYPGSYLGVRAPHPPNINYSKYLPTPNDWQGYVVGDLWIYIPNPTSSAGRLVFMLVSLVGNQALWIEFTSSTGTLTSLQGNSGGIVPPNGSGYINVIGDGTSINVTGNHGTSTLTINAITNGTSIVSTLTGNSGGAVSPSAGNINVKGDGTTINVVGNPGTNTLTISTIPGGGFIATISGNDNTPESPVAGNFKIVTAHSNIVFDGSAGQETLDFALTTNLLLGSNGAITSGASNTGVGNAALFSITSGSNNTAVGLDALNLLTTGSRNTGIGFNAVAVSTTASDNTALGYFALSTATSAQNTAVGASALALLTTGNTNTAVGYASQSHMTTGGSNTSVGWASLNNVTTGANNTAVGFQALNGVAGAQSNNTCIGYNAGVGYVTNTESSNILVGSSVQGTTGESNTCRIGVATGTSAGYLNQTFIAGIRGITTANNNAVAVLVDSANQLGTISSSIRYKEDVHDITGSDAIYDLRPVMFKYKHDKRQAWGLIAEEVKEVLPALVAHNEYGEVESVKYHDLPVLLLAEIQKLNKRITELESK